MKRIGFVSFILSLVLLIIAGFIIESSFVAAKTSTTTKIVILIFFNFTLLALFTLAFFVGRNLMRLYFEKRNRITGYRFKTKLVTIFVSITLIPSAMLFIISSGLVTNYIDKWFKPQVAQPLDKALSLAKNVYELMRKNTLEDALEISKGAKPSSKYVITKLVGPTGRISETIKNAFDGKEGTEVITSDQVDIVRAVIPIKKDNVVDEVLMVETTVPEELTRRVEEIQTAYREYITLKQFKLPLKANYLVILGFFTLLIVFLALWIALRISKGITEPIQSLAQATEKVAQGNLDTAVQLKRDDEIGMLVTSFNRMIEEIKGAEISLQQAYLESDRRRLFMENIVSNINSGVISIDADGRIITINDVACKILDIKADEVLNKHYANLINFIQSDDLKTFVKDINLYNFHSIKEQLKVSMNGRNMVLRIFIAQFKDAMQRPLGLLVVFDDLTELIQAEKALTWQDVAKRITHEIKNPLTPIKLSAERLLKRWENRDSNFDKIIRKSTSTIVREVDGLQRLVNEFSRLGKMPEIEPRSTDFKSLIHEVIDLYRDYENTRIDLRYKGSPYEVYVDSEKIKRVLINIIDNAIQAMNKKGRINISVYEDKSSENVIVEIADTGIGISQEDKEKLFQPYFSRRKDGTGLGLAIAHRIITDHKGNIAVSDNKPKGTIFRIEIPHSYHEVQNV